MIGSGMPLPVIQVSPASTPPVAPLTGSTAANLIAGPFEPRPGVPVMLQLSGVWSGTVQVMRTIDDGLTRSPLTVGGVTWARFSANACEPVWEETEGGAELYLDIAIGSGTLTYRVSQ